MDKIYLNFNKLRKQGFNGVIIALCLLFAIITLSYVLFHNPHRDLHAAICRTADNIRNYYRDQPSYWKLSDNLAKEASLIDKVLLKCTDYTWHVGQGTQGDVSMPNDNSFDIALNRLSKSACINLSELPIDKKQQLGLQKITIVNDEGRTEFAWGDEKNPLPIASYATRNKCISGSNTVIWTFR